MRPIILVIRRKTKVPTRRQKNHAFRSDWKVVGQIRYADSRRIFHTIGGGPIKTDAQLAQFIKDNYGPGIYSLISFRKGQAGMMGFWMVEIEPASWRRIHKNQSKREKELREYKQEVSKVQKQLKTEDNPDERQSLNEEVEFLKDVYSVDTEDESEKKKSGPSPYIKQTMPLYKNHSYESYKESQQREVEVGEFW